MKKEKSVIGNSNSTNNNKMIFITSVQNRFRVISNRNPNLTMIHQKIMILQATIKVKMKLKRKLISTLQQNSTFQLLNFSNRYDQSRFI